MLDVLMLTIDDNANTGWKTFKCLQRLGLSVMYFKGSVHPYLYPEQGIVHPELKKISDEERGSKAKLVVDVPKLFHFTENSKCVHFVSSRIVNTGTDLTKKKVVMQHSGRLYRMMHKNYNGILEPCVDANIIQMPDLMNLGAKNEHLIFFPVDTEFIKPQFKRRSDKLIIGHFPSLSVEKGTDKIVGIIKRLDEDPETTGRFDYVGVEKADQNVQTIWIEQLRRMAYCDVIIDVCAEKAQGRPYGEWGNTAFEAAALGKVVITNSHRLDMYEREYGCRPKMRIANNEEELEKQLRDAIYTKDLTKEREETRQWVHDCHGFDATAKRLKDRVYADLLR